MGIEKQRVAENGLWAQYADLVRPLDWRLAVAPDHLLHFVNALRDVHRERNPALARRLSAVAQKIRGTVLDLHRRENTGKPAARVLGGALDHCQRHGKALASARLIPFEPQIEVVFQPPARRREAGSEKAAHPALREQLDPAVPRR